MEGAHTEFGGMKHPFVEENDAPTESDPEGNVKGRMEVILGRVGFDGELRSRRSGLASLELAILLAGHAHVVLGRHEGLKGSEVKLTGVKGS
jgi:hypothetical protein